MEGRGNEAKNFNKAPVKVGESQEALELLPGFWHGPVLDSLCLLRVHTDGSLPNNKADRWGVEVEFLCLDK